MNENVIKYIENVTVTGVYKRDMEEPFYVFIQPNSSDYPQSTKTLGVCSYDKDRIQIPLIVNQWNPILIKEINITNDILSSFSVYIGLSDVRI